MLIPPLPPQKKSRLEFSCLDCVATVALKLGQGPVVVFGQAHAAVLGGGGNL